MKSRSNGKGLEILAFVLLALRISVTDGGTAILTDNGAVSGRGCSTGSGTSSTVTTTSTLSNLFSSDIGAWVGEGAVAIAIIIGLIWIKIIIIAIIAWWWYGSSGKNSEEQEELFGNGNGHGWGSPKPVYGPPKPQYGAPMNGYGRELYESFDFSRLSEHVLKALDFAEKLQSNSSSGEVDTGGREMKESNT